MYPRVVYKIVCKTNWSEFIKSGLNECRGFDNDIRDGFIHLSTHEQLLPTFLKKYDIKDKNKFNILAVDSDKVTWEKAKNGEIYPHLYSPLILGKNILWIYGLENYYFNVNGI